MKRFALVLLLGLLNPAFANNDRPDVVGRYSGCVDVTVTTTFQNFTSASLQNETAAAGTMLMAGLWLSEVTIVNTHESQSMFVQFRTGAGGDATTNRRRIPPQVAVTIPLYGVGATTGVLVVSLRGSAAGTTGQLCAFAVPPGT